MQYRFSQSDQADALLPQGGNAPDFRGDVEREFPLVQQHDQAAADLVTAARMAREAIAVGGVLLDVFLRTDNADIDRVWDSDPDPTYWPGVSIKAFYQPPPVEVKLTPFGADAPKPAELHFAYQQVLGMLGSRLLRAGDVVKIPYNSSIALAPGYYRITNATPTGNYRYTWLYLSCKLESLTGDITVQPLDPHEGVRPVVDGYS